MKDLEFFPRRNNVSLTIRHRCQANFFTAHPTAVSLLLGADTKLAFSALLIGIPTVAAIVAAILHCYLLSGSPTGRKPNSVNLRPFFIFLVVSSLSAITGNVVQAYGIKHASFCMMVRCCYVRRPEIKIFSV